MRKTKAVIVFVLLIQFLISPVITASAEPFRFEREAYMLHMLGIYDGSSTRYFNPDLGSEVDRQVAVSMLLKMFGKKNAVEAMSKEEADAILSKYSDNLQVVSWARPYMAYAVKSGMVLGTSETTLGPLVPMDAVSFSRMILRNLGYSDSGSDFRKSFELLSKISGMPLTEASGFNITALIKDDVVGIVYYALNSKSASGETLFAMLASGGAIKIEQASAMGILEYHDSDEPLYSVPVIEKNKPCDEDIIYWIIREALLSVSQTAVLPVKPASDNANKVFDTIKKVIRDNPQILYHSSSTYHSNGLLELVYSKDSDTAREHLSELENKAGSIIESLVTPDMNDYQKELAIHDYIVNNCRYDIENLRRGTLPPESYSAYGALVLGKAVCEGYAEAMKLLMDKAGIPCRVVVGISDGVGHAWNIVTIDGGNYHVDATWDDPVMEDGSNFLSYAYFNLTDGDISRDHSWSNELYPLCDKTVYNYYVYNNLAVRNHDEFTDLAVKQAGLGHKSMTVRIDGFMSGGFNVSRAVSEVCSKLGRSLSYIVNEDFGIIDLFFN